MTDLSKIDWNDDEAVVKITCPDDYFLFADSIGVIWMMSKSTASQGKYGDSWKEARTREAVQAFEREHNPAYQTTPPHDMDPAQPVQPPAAGESEATKRCDCGDMQVCDICQGLSKPWRKVVFPARPWRLQWYGSGEDRGYHIFDHSAGGHNGDRVASLGDKVSSDDAQDIVWAHNVAMIPTSASPMQQAPGELPPLQSPRCRSPHRYATEYKDCALPAVEGDHEWTKEQRDGLAKFAIRLLDELYQREEQLRSALGTIAALEAKERETAKRVGRELDGFDAWWAEQERLHMPYTYKGQYWSGRDTAETTWEAATRQALESRAGEGWVSARFALSYSEGGEEEQEFTAKRILMEVHDCMCSCGTGDLENCGTEGILGTLAEAAEALLDTGYWHTDFEDGWITVRSTALPAPPTKPSLEQEKNDA